MKTGGMDIVRLQTPGRFDFHRQRARQNLNYSLDLRKIDVARNFISLSLSFHLPSLPAAPFPRPIHCPLFLQQCPSMEMPCYGKSMCRPYAFHFTLESRTAASARILKNVLEKGARQCPLAARSRLTSACFHQNSDHRSVLFRWTVWTGADCCNKLDKYINKWDRYVLFHSL